MNEGMAMDERGMMTLIRELQLPLLHITQQAELYERTHQISLEHISTSTRHAMLLIENYLLLQAVRQQSLNLEPVSVSSVLYDVAHSLQPLARQYDCKVQLHIEGKYQPVVSNRSVLMAALRSLGMSLIVSATRPKSIFSLNVHKTGQGVAAGAYGEINGLSEKHLRQARSLYGQARQPLQSFSAQAGAGIFIADELLRLLGSELHATQRHNQKGLATILKPSRQLALV